MKDPSPMNREKRYWVEYAAEKAAALKMAAKLTAREKGLVVTDTKRRLVNEAMHDQTRQRRFERKFLSLEFPKDDGLPYDYSFGNREVNRMIRALDATQREHTRELRFWNALYRLRKYPELQSTLRAIRRFRVRQKIISALKIKGEVYDMRLSRVRTLLKILT